jgi:aryl-alcohol dehydrogenase-like predicted oxidoreductase
MSKKIKKAMQYRRLGNSALMIAPLILGGNVFGWTIDEPSSFTLLDAFIAGGYNCIDTADVYARWAPGNPGGISETIIGKWSKLRGNRKNLIIATKVGKEMGKDKKGLSAKYIRQAVHDSLNRLNTDYIDLYQSHEDDGSTALEETLNAYSELIREGKVRVIGASNYSAERLSEALAVSNKNGFARYESLQPLYNLYDRDSYEKELEPICLEKKIGVISYYSLASGFLTGKYRSEKDFSKSRRGGGMNKYMNEKGYRILKALDAVSAQYNCTPASVALAWIISRKSITAPIASATNPDQLKSLIKATQITLDEQALALLTEAGI